MNDLIERLEGVDDDTPGDYLVDLCWQAEHEIERLQAKVEALEAALEKITGKAMIVQAWEIARAALENNDG